MQALAAALPLAAVLILMTALGWRTVYAGLAAFGLALVLAFGVFGFGTERLAEPGPAAALAGALAEALFTTATIVWIIFPAVAIHEMQTRSGAIEHIRVALTRLSSDRRIQALFVALFFGMFMEGAAGFGTPVALAAPLLVGIGYTPMRAVALALVGHAAGVSFGAVGTPVLVQAALSGSPALAIARETGILHAALGCILVFFLMHIAGDARPTLRQWGRAALAAICVFVPYAAFAAFVGPELPTLGGALVGALCFAVLVRGSSSESGATGFAASLQAGLPYGVVLALILATRLYPPLQELLRAVEINWSFGAAFGGSVQPLYHPGTMLLLGFLIGGLAQGRSIGEFAAAAWGAGRRLIPVVLALAAMLALARLMVHAGMIDALARSAAESGWAWPLLAPMVGVLGTFVTGSATASNILFTEFQLAAATTLGLPAVTMLAAQGFGAAVGNIVCPHNVIAGGATVGLQGREGEVMLRTALVCAVYAAAGGVMVLLLVR